MRYLIFLILVTNAYGQKYSNYIEKASKEYAVSTNFIKAVIKQESNFNPNARSHAGAMGLMQLMPGTAKDMGVDNAYEPLENIMGGTAYLSELLKKYGNNRCFALAAYNWGSSRVDRLRKKYDVGCHKMLPHFPKETRGYIARIFRTLNLKPETSKTEFLDEKFAKFDNERLGGFTTAKK